MKIRVALLMLAVVVQPLWLAAQQKAMPGAAKQTAAKATTNPAFEKIKDLAGDWDGKYDGKSSLNTFRVISAGSAVLLTQTEPDGGEMVTVIHPDGTQLMATHYCSAKNQPRLVAVPSDDPNKIVFKFKDVTNLASPDALHIVGVVFTIIDKDHHTQTWTWSQGGKEGVATFQLARRK